MKIDRGSNRGSWRAGLLAVAAAVAVLATATACGGSASSSSAGSGSGSGSGSASGGSADGQMLAYSQCMRAHGVPDFPDPNASGNMQVAPGSPNDPMNGPQEQVANTECRHLEPGGGAAGTGGVNQQVVSQYLKLSQCMRAHGATTFPDPTVSGNNIYFKGTFDYNSPQWQQAERACNSLAPAGFFSSRS
jgi:hypothetical protein